MEVLLKVGYLPHGSCPYPSWILGENGSDDDDDERNNLMTKGRVESYEVSSKVGCLPCDVIWVKKMMFSKWTVKMITLHNTDCHPLCSSWDLGCHIFSMIIP